MSLLTYCAYDPLTSFPAYQITRFSKLLESTVTYTATIHVKVLYAANHLNAVRLGEAGRHCSVVQEYLVDRKCQVGGALRRTRAPLLPADNLRRATVDAVVGICVKRREDIDLGIRMSFALE